MILHRNYFENIISPHLVLVWVPAPQVALQVAQLAHDPQAPSTKNSLMYLKEFYMI